jgi:hypothetical protein
MNTQSDSSPLRSSCTFLSRLVHKTLMPDNRNIQMTNQMAITATTTYRIHCPKVFGSVRFSIRPLYLHFHLELRLSLWPDSEYLRDSAGQSVGHPLEAEVVGMRAVHQAITPGRAE